MASTKSKHVDLEGVSVKDTKEEEIGEIIQIFENNLRPPWERKDIIRLFYDDSVYYLTAKHLDSVVGFSIYRELPENGWYIMAIAVKREYQGRGVGSKLTDAVIARAGDAQVGKITLDVRTGNETARRLYEKYGFRYVGESLVHDDGLKMLLPLNGGTNHLERLSGKLREMYPP